MALGLPYGVRSLLRCPDNVTNDEPRTQQSANSATDAAADDLAAADDIAAAEPEPDMHAVWPREVFFDAVHQLHQLPRRHRELE